MMASTVITLAAMQAALLKRSGSDLLKREQMHALNQIAASGALQAQLCRPDGFVPSSLQESRVLRVACAGCGAPAQLQVCEYCGGAR